MEKRIFDEIYADSIDAEQRLLEKMPHCHRNIPLTDYVRETTTIRIPYSDTTHTQSDKNLELFNTCPKRSMNEERTGFADDENQDS